ncbi:hypothetical protein [Clostridium rectalis]|nr:hypothetical protein [Clostridium rectalis]
MYDLYLKESNKSGMRLMLPNKLSKGVAKVIDMSGVGSQWMLQDLY